MKVQSRALALVLLSLSGGIPAALAEEVLIDTKFQETSPEVRFASIDEQGVPLTMPTSIQVPESGAVKIVQAEEDLMGFGKEFAVIEVGDQPERAAITWQINSETAGGVYELEFALLSLDDIQNGARMRFTLRDQAGQNVTSAATIGMVGISNGKLSLRGASSVPVHSGSMFRVKVRIDFNEGKWGAWLDDAGVPTMEDFGEGLTGIGPNLRPIALVFEAAGTDPTPDVRFAIGGVRLVRLE